jgi:cysteine synthase A
MMRYHHSDTSILNQIGHTPIIQAQRLGQNLPASLWLKLEAMNPCSSVKDRIGAYMVAQAEASGRIHPERTVLIEPTSGNTGIALAFVAAAKGYKLILTMPETMSMERRVMLQAFGAKVVLTPAAQGMKGAIACANALQAAIPESVILQQFENPDNPEIHFHTTGPEIWEAMEGRVDALIAGVGTGGTITGTGRYLRTKNPEVALIAVEPAESPVLSGGQPSPHKIQGIGAGFIPEVLDTTLLNEIITVPSHTAIETARALAQQEGILCGISSGAAFAAALQLAERPAMAGKRLVVVLPSFGERYLTSALFHEDWEQAQALETHLPDAPPIESVRTWISEKNQPLERQG